MIKVFDEQNEWQHHFGKFDPATIAEFIDLGRHWVQIKTLERNDVVIYEGQNSNPEFEAKMRWVAEFLFDLHKKIWQ